MIYFFVKNYKVLNYNMMENSNIIHEYELLDLLSLYIVLLNPIYDFNLI